MGYGVVVSFSQMLENDFEFGAELGYRTDKQSNKNSFLGEFGFTFDRSTSENKILTFLGKSNYFFEDIGLFRPYIGIRIAFGRITSLNSGEAESVNTERCSVRKNILIL